MDTSIKEGRKATRNKMIYELMSDYLNQIEALHPFSKNNFAAMERLVFLWIIGKDRSGISEMERLLRTETQTIVKDERTVCFLTSPVAEITGEGLFGAIYDHIDRIAGSNLEIDHLFELVICPIFLPECMEREDDALRISHSCIFLQEEMRKRSRSLEWHPYLLIRDRMVDRNKMMVRWTSSIMNEIINEAGKFHHEVCFPCCLLSDINERGQEISQNQNAKTIVMLTVFQNTNCENEADIRMILQPIKKYEENYFVTARAVSVCEPVKSIFLNRMLALHLRLFYGTGNGEAVFENWQHSYFQSKEWKQVLSAIPHNAQDQVLTQAVYSIIPVGDPAQFEERLRKFSRRYYFDPIEEGLKYSPDKWWKGFWEEFFLRKFGSPGMLTELEDKSGQVIDTVPPVAVAPAEPIRNYIPDYRFHCEEWIKQELAVRPRQMVAAELGIRSERMEMFRKKRNDMMETADDLRRSLENMIMSLGQTEFLLNTGGGVAGSARDEAVRWIDERIAQREITDSIQKYQKLFFDYFSGNALKIEDIWRSVLGIYRDVILETIESRGEYMSSKLAVLAGTDMRQLFERLEDSWKYPVHLANGFGRDTNPRLYMMGNRHNMMCMKIIEQSYYSVAFAENALDERVEIVRVSERFSENEIFAEGSS